MIYKLYIKSDWLELKGTFYQDSPYSAHVQIYKLKDEIKELIDDLVYLDEYYYATHTNAIDIKTIVEFNKWYLKFNTEEDMLMAKFRL